MSGGAGGHNHGEPDAPAWSVPAPLWFWIVSGACVLWNALGAVDFTLAALHVRPWMALMPQGVAAFAMRAPGWVAGAWALGVWGALAGALLMLARLRQAAVAYALSFAGAVGALAWSYAHGVAALGGQGIGGTVLGLMLVQLWLSRAMFWRGVLR